MRVVTAHLPGPARPPAGLSSPCDTVWKGHKGEQSELIASLCFPEALARPATWAQQPPLQCGCWF